jgi:hypothetical protein
VARAGAGALGGAAPTTREQAAIVRFLDWANGRLERAIRAKRKVIALLNEQKQAIIHRAVTRGLDPSVPLKPSGIPWLGDIPQHWRLEREIDLLREYRTRLVADVVTGKLDVREAAARLPEDAALDNGDSEADLDPELTDEAAEA